MNDVMQLSIDRIENIKRLDILTMRVTYKTIIYLLNNDIIVGKFETDILSYDEQKAKHLAFKRAITRYCEIFNRD
jgi:hypothetical protein